METIIIQEPDSSIREVLKLALEAEDFNVLARSKCEDRLLTLIQISRASLVILDFLITGEECIKMGQMIKAAHPNLPVLVMSCNSNIKDIYRSYGFDDYIEKPFDLDVLCQTVRQYALVER